ncbi:MAG TPA: PH domain-containing protein, partial [Brevibacterium sp.]|nr:PH domain-containing protein [Brevibacterium sp.]
IAAAETRATAAVGIGLLAFFVALYSALTLLLLDSFRTSVLATDHGVEVRQFPLRTRRVAWSEIDHVDAQQTGYRTGASVLVLTTGERIVCLATDPRRAVHNGYGLRSFQGPGGRIFSPTTAELIDCHRRWISAARPRS